MNESVEKQALGFLGLCTRAGQLQSGQEACVNAVRAGTVAVVMMDQGSSPNTIKRVTDACHSHQTPLYEVTKGALGSAIGKAGRMVAAVPEGNMARKLLTLLDGQPRL